MPISVLQSPTSQCLKILLDSTSGTLESRAVTRYRLQYLRDHQRHADLLTLALKTNFPASALDALIHLKDFSSPSLLLTSLAATWDPAELSRVQSTALRELAQPNPAPMLLPVFFFATMLRERLLCHSDFGLLALACGEDAGHLASLLNGSPNNSTFQDQLFSSGWTVRSSYKELLGARPEALCMPNFDVMGGPHSLATWARVQGEVAIRLLGGTRSALLLAHAHLLVSRGLPWLALKALDYFLDVFPVRLDTPPEEINDAMLSLLFLSSQIPNESLRREIVSRGKDFLDSSEGLVKAAEELEQRGAHKDLLVELLRQAGQQLAGHKAKDVALATKIARKLMQLAPALGDPEKERAVVEFLSKNAEIWCEGWEVTEALKTTDLRELLGNVLQIIGLPGPDTRLATLQNKLQAWEMQRPLLVLDIRITICQCEPDMVLYTSLKDTAARMARLANQNPDEAVKQMRNKLLVGIQKEALRSPHPARLRDTLLIFVLERQHHYIRQLAENNFLKGEDYVFLTEASFFVLFVCFLRFD